MALPVDHIHDFQSVKRGLEFISGRFPLKQQDIASGAVGTGSGGTVAIAQLPQARVFNSAGQSIPNNAETALTFDSERYDLVPTGLTEQHSTSANTSRLTCQVAGLYEIGGCFRFGAFGNTGCTIQAFIRLNGTTNIARVEHGQNSTTKGTAYNPNTQYRLAVSDYVELCVLQDSGVAQNTSATGNESPEFWFSWRSP